MDTKYFKDGNEFCCYDGKQFINLQESIAGFGKTKEKALINLVENMNKKIIDLNGERPHQTNSVICLACLKDWQAVYPDNLEIKDLYCPDCGQPEVIKFNVINSRKIIKTLKNLVVNGGDIIDTLIKECK